MTSSTITIHLETQINASPEIVWTALTAHTSEWWTKDFYTSPKTKSFHIQAHIGGMMYEDMGNGEGLVWATVIGVDKPNSLQMKGQLSPEFGGPAISFFKIDLQANEQGTLFKLSDTYMGAVDEKTKKYV